MTKLVGTVRARWIGRKSAPGDELYRTGLSRRGIRDWQLRRFNELWKTIARESPHYRSLRTERGVSDQFDDWREFSEQLPIMTRESVRGCVDQMRTSLRPADYRRVTGGSTAEPIQLPAWRSEDRIAGLDSWRGRSWFGVDAADRLFLLWGHSHLLGEGIGGWFSGKWRALKDFGFGYRRCSAYDLSDPALHDAALALLNYNPDYVVGYSTALHRLAHVNQQLHEAFRRLRLKVVIATGESFPSSESSTLISRVFGCPVAMEYGAVETGVIAHQRRDGRFQVFWGNYFLEGIESDIWPGRYELLVTTLYPRLIPLIRYSIGDLAFPNPSAADFDQTLERIVGRCNDGISIGEGAFIHSEAFSHVLRDVEDIQAFQVIQNAPDKIVVNYIASGLLSDELQTRLHRRFESVDKRLKIHRFQRVTRLQETISGKTRRIVNEGAARIE